MRQLMVGLTLLAVVGALFAVVWLGEQSAEIEREHARQVEALQAEAERNATEADKLSAAAAADLAQAELERAQGQRSREEAMGRAIEYPAKAAANAVDVQSEVVASMGRTNTLMMRSIPAGLILGVGLLLMGSFFAGLVGALFVGQYVRSRGGPSGIFLAPRGSHGTDPFAGQDNEPGAYGARQHLHQFDER
jgi:multidrug efflux pump subunit AcrA (membrane-fusion protein)